MKSSYRKKLEKAVNYLREVYEDLETEGSDDFDEYGTRLDDLAGEIEDILEEDETRSKEKDDEDDDEEDE
jgi:hypothetical protein